MSLLTPWYTPYWYVGLPTGINPEDRVNMMMAEGAEAAWACPDKDVSDEQRRRLAEAIKEYGPGGMIKEDVIVRASRDVIEKIVARPRVEGAGLFVRDCEWAGKFLEVPEIRCPPGVLEKAVVPTLTVGAVGVVGRFLEWW